MLDILITTLNALMIVLMALGIAAVVLMVLMVAVDLTWYRELVKMDFDWLRNRKFEKVQEKEERRKELLRRAKEESARETFFGDFYAPGFDADGRLINHYGSQFPTEKSREYYREMNKRVDDQIFENTEVL